MKQYMIMDYYTGKQYEFLDDVDENKKLLFETEKDADLFAREMFKRWEKDGIIFNRLYYTKESEG